MLNEEVNLEKIDKKNFFFEENWFFFVYIFVYVNRLCFGLVDVECWENVCVLKVIVVYCIMFGYKWEIFYIECFDYFVLYWW